MAGVNVTPSGGLITFCQPICAAGQRRLVATGRGSAITSGLLAMDGPLAATTLAPAWVERATLSHSEVSGIHTSGTPWPPATAEATTPAGSDCTCTVAHGGSAPAASEATVGATSGEAATVRVACAPPQPTCRQTTTHTATPASSVSASTPAVVGARNARRRVRAALVR